MFFRIGYALVGGPPDVAGDGPFPLVGDMRDRAGGARDDGEAAHDVRADADLAQNRGDGAVSACPAARPVTCKNNAWVKLVCPTTSATRSRPRRYGASLVWRHSRVVGVTFWGGVVTVIASVLRGGYTGAIVGRSGQRAKAVVSADPAASLGP